MCGITGFIDFRGKSSFEHLTKMTKTLSHRGPDGEGLELINTTSAQVGLGHRRLAILDLSDHGKQPMAFEHLWVCFNGEIYNFREIKSELLALGHSFNGDSDTEMILHAYAEWGIDCIEKFIGMFAIVLFDTQKNKVVCIRDRAGVKPFFYYWKDGLFLFSSELKAFHEHPNFDKKINKDAAAAFLQYGNIPSSHCIFENCEKLNPGHYLTLDFETRKIEKLAYWNVYDHYNASKLDLSYSEAITKTETLLKSAFEYRMVSDVPVGVFLSGGFDSACVTSILQAERTEKLKTFTIGVPDLGLNEAPYAKDIAKHLGTDHTEITCTQSEAIDLIKDLPFHFDEPFADSSAIPTTLVSKMARKEVTVALSADAGDEIFAGYNRYDYMARYGTKLNKIPGFARKSIAGIMNKVPSDRIPILKNKYNFHNRYEKLKQVLKDPSDQSIMFSLSQQFTDGQIQGLVKHDVSVLDTAYGSTELKNNHTPLSYMMAVDYQTYLVDDILQKVDRSTMAVSLEGREPFLDHRIIEFAARLPNHFKYHEGVKKRILRDIVHKYIPEKLMDRPKMGFAIPIAKWLNTDLKPYVEEYISQKKIDEQGIFEWSEIDKIKKAFFGGKKEYDVKIWYILMFQMWYERWMK
ncbi:MAG: asparagine synthase (glutamine-hydrolyzing) [Crocinitomicaceae bacterium]|nr:asparagine synthase (glutamine-hydrolyzing) [Crocinitomicaceae bacterium]